MAVIIDGSVGATVPIGNLNAQLIQYTYTVPAKEQAAKDVKTSALAKLDALGLTQDEVKALVG